MARSAVRGLSALLVGTGLIWAQQSATAAAPDPGAVQGPTALAPASTPASESDQPTPGDSGGATVAVSGQTLSAGQFQLSFGLTDVEYHSQAFAAIINGARRVQSYNSIDREISPTLEIDYGITDRFQIGVESGYFYSEGYREGDLQRNGSVEFGSATFAGPADTWLLAKYELLDDNRTGFLSPYAGLKIPTGRDDVRLSDGIPIKATDQPGTGAYDFKLGLAYSRFLTDRITTDASAEYVIHTEHAGAHVGNDWTLAIDAAYRLSDSTHSLPRYSIFAQAFATILDKDTLYDAQDPNSGGTTLYLGPGLFAQLTDSLSLTVGPAFPVYQQLFGGQVKAQVQYILSIGYTF